MRIHIMIALLLAAFCLSAQAAPGNGNGPQRDKEREREREQRAIIRVVVVPENDQDELRAYQLWFGQQVRGYEEIDRDTSERLSDLLHVVTGVAGNEVTVAGRHNMRQTVTLNRGTQVIFQEMTPTWAPPGLHRGRPANPPGAFAAQRLRPGDLVTVDGLGMLLHQGVPGFARWFGVRPEVDAGLRALIVEDLRAKGQLEA